MNAEVGAEMSSSLLIGLGVVIGIGVIALIWGVVTFRPNLTSRLVGQPITSIAQATIEIDKLRLANQMLQDQFVTSEIQRRETENKLRTAEMHIAKLSDQVRNLLQQLEANNVIPPLREELQICVLGVWTKAPGLDPQANAETLAIAGVEYTELSGMRASMEGILYALPLRNYTAIEVGARGEARGIELQDGLATVQWWADLAKLFKVDTFLFLADHSGTQTQTSIAERVFQSANVRNVISVDGEVDDVVARRYARMLYARWAEGQSLSQAHQMAKLAVGPHFGRLFRLRTKEESGD